MSEQLINYIKTLIPLCDIKKEKNLENLYKNILLGRMSANKTLYHSGENNEFTFYLLLGQLTLVDANDNETILTAEDPRCRFPVGYDQSHKYTVKTNTTINYLKINSQTLDVLLTWDQTTTPLLRKPVKDQTEKNKINWMSKILELELFQRIPPTNIQAMFQRFETIQLEKNDVVIEQDSEAAYYYVLKSGRAAVYRTDADDRSNPTKLAELGPGEAFGEEGLVANSPRNASIIMLEDGELARLPITDFHDLLVAPVMKSVAYQEALQLIDQGASYIDVRTANEFRHNHLAESQNLPLLAIREHLAKLDNNHLYIVYCDTGSRSRAACYILNQHGYDAILLENGLNLVPSDAILHPKEN